jgi:hypothetical protein
MNHITVEDKENMQIFKKQPPGLLRGARKGLLLFFPLLALNGTSSPIVKVISN